MRILGCLGLLSTLLLAGCAADAEFVPPPAPTASPSPSAASASPAPAPAPVPVDGGPAVGANGTVKIGASGVPESYVVAEHDNASGILARLGLEWWQLETPEGERLGSYPTLYPGDVIVLAPPAAP